MVVFWQPREEQLSKKKDLSKYPPRQNPLIQARWFCLLFPRCVCCCCCCCCCIASVVSDSVQPHRRQPTRLPRPWDSPGKNTGVGCHFLFQCMKVKSESEVAQLCPTPRDLPGSSIHGIFQARVLEWAAIAFYWILFLSWDSHYWSLWGSSSVLPHLTHPSRATHISAELSSQDTVPCLKEALSKCAVVGIRSKTVCRLNCMPGNKQGQVINKNACAYR